MKTICLVVQSVYDFDPRVRRKAEALVKTGYSVDVLALAPADGKTSYVLNGVNVSAISLSKKRGTLSRYFFEYLFFFIWVFFRAPLQMTSRRYSVIDVNSLPDFLVFAPIVARCMGAKLLLDLHEITPEFYMSKYGISEPTTTIRILTWLEKISVAFADHVLTINEPIENLLCSRGLQREKCDVIMNAVDEDRFTKSSPAVVPRDPSKFVMMYHGTLTNIYGLDLAIEALALVHEEIPGAELWILGSGPQKESLIALAKRRDIESSVRFVGQVPANEIPAWLGKCDAGILPIRRDIFLDFAFPNKLPEFIVAGKVVLVSRLKAIRHYFSENALAYYTPNDPVDLGKQMVRLYNDRAIHQRMQDTARREYVPIRWEVMKNRYLKVVERLADPQAIAIERARATHGGTNS